MSISYQKRREVYEEEMGCRSTNRMTSYKRISYLKGARQTCCQLQRQEFTEEFYAHQSVHRESILKMFQQDDTLFCTVFYSLQTALHVLILYHYSVSVPQFYPLQFVTTRCCRFRFSRKGGTKQPQYTYAVQTGPLCPLNSN
jgi:hypothetical protein